MCAKKRFDEQISSELEQIGKKRDDEEENENEQLYAQMKKFASKCKRKKTIFSTLGLFEVFTNLKSF